MKNKKLIILSTLIIMSFFLVSCGNQNAFAGQASKGATDERRVIFANSLEGFGSDLAIVQANYLEKNTESYDFMVREVFSKADLIDENDIIPRLRILSRYVREHGIEGLEAVTIFHIDKLVDAASISSKTKENQLATLRENLLPLSISQRDRGNKDFGLSTPVRCVGCSETHSYLNQDVRFFLNEVLSKNDLYSIILTLRPEDPCSDLDYKKNSRKKSVSLPIGISSKDCDGGMQVITGIGDVGLIPGYSCEETHLRLSPGGGQSAGSGELATLIWDCLQASISSGNPLSSDGTTLTNDPIERSRIYPRNEGNWVVVKVSKNGNFYSREIQAETPSKLLTAATKAIEEIEEEIAAEEAAEEEEATAEEEATEEEEETDSDSGGDTGDDDDDSSGGLGGNPDPHTPPAMGGVTPMNRKSSACHALEALLNRNRDSATTLMGTTRLPDGRVVRTWDDGTNAPEDSTSGLGPCPEDPLVSVLTKKGTSCGEEFKHCPSNLLSQDPKGACSCNSPGTYSLPRRPLIRSMGTGSTCMEVALPCPPEERRFVHGMCECVSTEIPEGGNPLGRR
jgi:hypothetical protein